MKECRVCGCTDEDPCAGGCSWINDTDLCSGCAEVLSDFLMLVVGHLGGQRSTGERIMRGIAAELLVMAEKAKLSEVDAGSGLCIDAFAIAKMAEELEGRR